MKKINMKKINMKKIFVLKDILLLSSILLSFYLPIICIGNDNRILIYLGIVSLYSCNYFFINSLKKIVKIENNNIFEIFIKLFLPFYSLKIILHNNYKNFDNIFIITICCIIILYNNKFFIRTYLNREKLINSFSLNNLEEFCLTIIPFYLLKTGSIKIIPILVILFLYKLIIKKEKIPFEIKKIDIILLLFFLTLLVTSYFNEFTRHQLETIERIFIPFFLFLVLVQIPSKIKNYKNIIFVSLSSIIIFYIPLFICWKENNFNYSTRLMSFVDITQTGVILGILQLLLLFYIILDKNLKVLPLFFINFNFLILTGSKGPLLLVLFFVPLVGIILLKRKIKLIFIFFCGIILIILFFTNISTGINRLKVKNGSTQTRILLYIESFEQFKEKPILGYGIGTYKTIAQNRHQDFIQNLTPNLIETNENSAYNRLIYTHSNFWELARGSGIFSLIFYYTFILYLLYKNTLMYFKTNNKILLLGIFSLLYFEIYGLIDNNILYEKLQGINLFIAALFIIYRNSTQNNKEENG